jgi:hypothetical protein
MTKTALITTTINVPRVLELYRKIGPDVHFFVVGDRKTPHNEVRRFVQDLGNTNYYSDTDQEKLGYSCSDVIGWNKIMRRNIAILEALRHGAEIIVSIDDDNIPLDNSYFQHFERTLTQPFNGVIAVCDSGWFNIGGLLIPPVYHRGFPLEQRHQKFQLKSVTGTRVGVSAGLWLGDPDTDAVNKIANSTRIVGVSDVLKAGLVVQKGCFSPFDSQNTAYLRDLAPLMLLQVGIGRYDDIWASYVAERVMAETDYHIHYGQPLTWQERNPQSAITNLQDEIYGMQYTARFAEDLRKIELSNKTVLGNLTQLQTELSRLDYLPSTFAKLAEAWLRDLETIR